MYKKVKKAELLPAPGDIGAYRTLRVKTRPRIRQHRCLICSRLRIPALDTNKNTRTERVFLFGGEKGIRFALIGSRARSLRFALGLSRKTRPRKKPHCGFSFSRLRIPPFENKQKHLREAGAFVWRRERDSNP
ncbi:MAG: hypothetical protein IKO51_07245 [Clostridia bacterium]|nr:hypothetical protein [Clostridia bacterium]